jgi:hypothetical protein
MTRTSIGVLALLFFATPSFSQIAPQKPPSINERVEQLEKRVNAPQQRVSDISLRAVSTFVTLDCDSHRFVELRPNESHFLLFASCNNVEPYLEGHRVTIRVGNPYAIPVTRITGKLWFGENLYQSVANNRNVEIPMPDGLHAASWNTFVVNVNPSKATDLRNVMVEFDLSTVSLSNR